MFQTTNQYITDKTLKISVVISYGLIMKHKWSDLLAYNWFNWYFGPSLHIYIYIYTSKLGLLMLDITKKNAVPTTPCHAECCSASLSIRAAYDESMESMEWMWAVGW